MGNNSLQGLGRSRFELTPVLPGGRARNWQDVDSNIEIVGVHVGDYAGLNIANPQPECQYQHVANNPQSIMRARNMGGQVIQRGDPDFPAYELGLTNDQTDLPTPLDTSHAFGDIVPMRFPEAAIRSKIEAANKLAESRLRGSQSDFIAGATPNEIMQAGGRMTRFARQDHGYQITADGQTVDVWNPEKGIVG